MTFYADIAALRPAIHGKTEDLISQLGALANSRSRKVQVDSQHPDDPVADALRNVSQRQLWFVLLPAGLVLLGGPLLLWWWLRRRRSGAGAGVGHAV